MFERGRPPVTNTPPFGSMEELMNGELSYAMAVPDTPNAALTIQARTPSEELLPVKNISYENMCFAFCCLK